MKITKLIYQKKDPNRVNVYIDGKFTAGLEANDILKLGLYSGQEIEAVLKSKILHASGFGSLYSSALQLLSRRPRSEREMRTHLMKKIKDARSRLAGGRDETKDREDGREKVENGELMIDLVIEKLRKLGQINDEAFARWFLEQRTQFKQKGSRAVKSELFQKGISREIAEEVLGNRGKESEKELAERAAGKKLPTLRRRYPEERELSKRLENFLLARGFDWETVSEVVAKLVGKRYNDF